MAIRHVVPKQFRSLISRAYFSILKGVRIGSGSRVDLRTQFEGRNVVGANCQIGRCHIGFGTYVGDGTLAQRAAFGRFCSCGSNVTLSLGRHPTRDFVSTHPAFYSTRSQAGFTYVSENRFEEHVYSDRKGGFLVSIANDVWIGNNVLIMDGVTIHNGAVVGAGAVVTKDVEAYTIVVGVPARSVGRRFDESTVEALQNSRWWDLDPDVLRDLSHLFADAHAFLEALEGRRDVTGGARKNGN